MLSIKEWIGGTLIFLGLIKVYEIFVLWVLWFYP